MSTITQAILAKNVKRLRQLHSLTQKELGQMLGVGNAQISKYEAGVDFPAPSALDKMASIFQVHICDLFMSETAAVKKAELQGVGSEDVLIMLNRSLKKAGFAMIALNAQKEAG